MLQPDRLGNVRFWKTPLGQIIPLMTKKNGKIRGGSFPTAPVHGLPPNDPAWAGVNLPQHGHLRNGAQYHTGYSLDPHNNRQSFHFKHLATPDHPWDYMAEVQLKEFSDATANSPSFGFTHGVTLKRSAHCTNEKPMPFSMGLHPYFNVTDEKFELLINNVSVLTQDEIELCSPKFFPLTRDWNEVTLRTGDLVITINTSGADEIIVWTDSLGYICVEPVYARRETKVFIPGESHELLCGFQVARE